jgi:hypothetical protein
MEDDLIIAMLTCATWDDPRGRHMEFIDSEADLSIRVSVGNRQVDPDVQTSHMIGLILELPHLVADTISKNSDHGPDCTCGEG